MPLLPQWHQRSKRRMKPEESVKIEGRCSRNVDGRAHGVVRGFTVRNYDVESVRRAPLKNDDQPFVAHSWVGRAKSRARQKRWNGSSANHCQPAVTNKNSTRYRHKISHPTFIASEIPVSRAAGLRSSGLRAGCRCRPASVASRSAIASKCFRAFVGKYFPVATYSPALPGSLAH